MYRTIIINGSTSITIQDASASKKRKLSSGKITREPNSIASYSFELYPHNVGYNEIVPLQTLVHVWNIKKQKYEFKGRVLKAYPEMDGNGVVVKRVICEDRLGYLNDSIQPYVEMTHYTGDATRTGLEQFIDVVLGYHNAHVEADKRIYRGRVTVVPFKTTSDVTKQLNYPTTWTALREKLPMSFGGYLVLRETNGVMYLDYLEEVGTTRATVIALGRNMKSASRELDPTNVITRLYPLGAKIKALDENGQEVETEERVSIRSVNGGLDYIDAPEYIEQFGIIEGTYIWDDVTIPSNLLTRGLMYLSDSNGIYASNRITALDLSLLGIDPDDFVLFDKYPVVNSLIGLNDTLQIVKQTIDTVQPEQSTFDMGDTVRRMSDLIADSQSPAKGEAGRSSYLHIRYSENASGADMTTTPTEDTKYIGLAETTSPVAPVDYTAYTWSSFAGQDGKDGKDGKDGDDGQDGNDGVGITGTEIRYQVGSSGTTAPSGTWLSNVPPTVAGDYLWTRVVTTYSNGNTSTYYSVSYHGDRGTNGTNGKDGKDGKDGTSVTILGSYDTYADLVAAHPTGSTGDSYIVDGDLYIWSVTSGSSGQWLNVGTIQGPPGANGTDGTSSYIFVRYSANANGTGMKPVPDSTTLYIGICVTTNATDQSDYTKYTWSRYVGKDGQDGQDGKDGKDGKDGVNGQNGSDGVSIVSTTPYYCIGNSPSVKPSDPSIPEWVVNPRVLRYGEYLWCSYLITYSAGNPQWTEPFNLRSADDLVQASTAPDSPTEGMLWLDTSSDTYTLMRYNGTDWDIVADTTEQMNAIFTKYDTKFEAYDKTLEGLSQEFGNVTTSVSDTQQIVETMKTILGMDAEGVSLTFQRIAESITAIDGNVNTQKSTLEKYIRFVNGTIEIGEKGADTMLKLENDILGFYQNGVRVAYFNSGKLFVDKLEAITSLQLGRYAFVPNTTGGMSLKYTGE